MRSTRRRQPPTPLSNSPTPSVACRLERACRESGATCVALAVVAASCWVLFALVYKTQLYVRTGKFYVLGAPTAVGRFNRVMLIGIICLGTCGAVIALVGKALRLRLQLRSCRTGREPQPTDPQPERHN